MISCWHHSESVDFVQALLCAFHGALLSLAKGDRITLRNSHNKIQDKTQDKNENTLQKDGPKWLGEVVLLTVEKLLFLAVELLCSQSV